MKMYLAVIIAVIWMSGVFTLGWMGNNMYQDLNNKRIYNGLWIAGNLTQSKAIETAESYDTYGHWICVNIKGMDIKEMQSIILHETMHEYFAEKCTLKNEDKCITALEGIK